eukprot:SAG11_NODE_5894_length_1439_cov_1.565672_1_plen_93_part_00
METQQVDLSPPPPPLPLATAPTTGAPKNLGDNGLDFAAAEVPLLLQQCRLNAQMLQAAAGDSDPLMTQRVDAVLESVRAIVRHVSAGGQGAV